MRNDVAGQLSDLGTNALWQYIQPVFVLSAPRAGSTLLFELLIQHLPCFSIGNESHGIYAQFPSLHKENSNYDSGSLGADHAKDDISRELRLSYAEALHDCNGRAPEWSSISISPDDTVFVEKTPRNALNIPFLLRVFPHARFIYLYRDGQQNIASLAEAWKFGLRTGHFVTYPNLPGFSHRHWCFLLPPGWRKVSSSDIPDIAAFQWLQTNRIIQKELAKLPRAKWCSISYESLIEAPATQMKRLASFCNLPLSTSANELKASALPLSATTLSKPDPNKWKLYLHELAKHKTAISQMMKAIRDFSTDTSE